MSIHIEFCERWNYQPEFDRVSKIITAINSNSIIDGNKKNPRTGSFEVEVNGKTVFSKLQTGKFPSEVEIKSWF